MSYLKFAAFNYAVTDDATISPQSCGYDEISGEDKICCDDYSGIPMVRSQPPKFPLENSKARPCLDHTKQCTKWVQKFPESCQPGHKSYIFMREACQESCGRCKNDVILYHILTYIRAHSNTLKMNVRYRSGFLKEDRNHSPDSHQEI